MGREDPDEVFEFDLEQKKQRATKYWNGWRLKGK